MFEFDKPFILSSTPETGPLYQYLYKLVEYMNVSLNHIDPAQIEKESFAKSVKEIAGDPVDNAMGIFRAFVQRTTAADDIEVDDGSMNLTLNLRKYMGLVFLHIGPTMANIPISNDPTDLTTIPFTYRPMNNETMDWTDPNGERYRLYVYTNGGVKIRNYNSTLRSSITTNIHMVFPAANL